MASSRGWFSKRPSTQELANLANEKQPIHVDVSKSAFKFNTFAAVMGKKPKKQSLAFHDHSPTNGVATIHDRPYPPNYTNRPPSKSISSTVRSGDSSEPLTPSDAPPDRMSFPRSVFTISDADPFAAGSISLPQSIADSSRLSVFSNSSVNDGFSKKDSHLSFGLSSPLSTSSFFPAPPDVHDRSKSPSLPILPQRSMAPLLENPAFDIISENGSTDRWDATIRPSLSKSGSLATLTDKTSSETHTPRILTRPRGYTESASSRPSIASSHVVRKGSSQTDNQPLAALTHLEVVPPLTRKHSSSRLVTLPPTAPPIHDLPPTPLTPLRFDHGHQVSPTLSSSDSGASFSVTNGSGNSSRNTRSPILNDVGLDPGCSEDNKKSSRRPKEPSHNSLADIFAQRPSSKSPTITTHGLKKSVSHSTLQKASLADDPHPPPSAGPISNDRDFKQQTALRTQSPSLPRTRQPNSPFTSNPSASETNLPAESKRSITNSPPTTVRRRLFSGSSNRRPSLPTTEDDSQSVFSLPTEAERTLGMTSLYAGSLLDEADSDAVPSGIPAPAPDYAQQIMSPAEMLKVEAMVQSEFDSKYGELLRSRQRNTSFTSASAPPFTATYTKDGLSTAPTSFTRFRGSYNSGSPARPSTAEDFSPPPLCQSPISPVGLPPAPRARSHSHTPETTQSDLSGRRLSSLPANPLAPPPRKRSPPSRVSTCGDKAPHRPVIRKPSFLEISDDAPSYDDSFLDLGGKNSFDLDES